MIHFAGKNILHKKNSFEDYRLVTKLLVLFLIPFAYVILRKLFWYPKPRWIGYHSIHVDGMLMGFQFFVVGLILSGLIAFISFRINRQKGPSTMLIGGWIVFALALFPYFTAGKFIRGWIAIFALRSDWGGRHTMLTPLGAAIIMLALRDLIPRNLQKNATIVLVTLCVLVNVFFGTQFYLDSIKKDELVELLARASATKEIDQDSEIVFVDETKIFNGRWSTYRNPELFAKTLLVPVGVKGITGKITCSELPQGLELRLRTNKSYLSALVSQDLGLYLEINNC